jgi:hypothetical protein
LRLSSLEEIRLGTPGRNGAGAAYSTPQENPFVPRGPRQIHRGHLTEITIKTFQARFLLTPSKLINRLIIGVLALAQEKYALTVCAVVVMSNHDQVLVVPKSESQVMRFCRYVSSNISREVGRLRGWTGGIFRRRYTDIVVTHEVAAHAGRLRYLLSHGVKEGLVRRPQDWPGVHSLKALLGSFRLRGDWVDRTGLYEARRRSKRRGTRKSKRPREADYTKSKVVVLSKIPAWEHLCDEEYRLTVADLVDSILEEHEERRQSAPKNVRRVLASDPTYRPETTKRSPKPALPRCFASGA